MATQLATLFLRRLEVPIVITDVDAGARRGGRRCDPRRPREAGLARPARRGQGALPRLDRQRRRRPVRLRRLRPRDRGRLRGDLRQARGVRRARGGGLGGVPARHEHLVAVGRRDGGRAAASGARRRHALLQPRRGAPARRARAGSGDRRCDARDRLGRDEEARQARRARQGCARLRRQPAADPPVVRPHAGARERQHVRGDGRGGVEARAPDAPVGAARDGRPAGREPRAPHAPRRVPRPVPALADARELRERRDGHRPHRRRPALRGRDLRARSSRRSPTRRGTCSTRASSRRRARSTRA